MGFLLHFRDYNGPLYVSLYRDRGYKRCDWKIPTAESALRAGSDGNPPLNMRNALIFQAVIICVASLLVIGLKGKQNRRERDEMEAGRAELDQPNPELPVVEQAKEA